MSYQEKDKSLERDSSVEMLSPKLREMLEKSWAPVFHARVFCQIDETVFAPLIQEIAEELCVPVSFLVSLEVFKHFLEYHDEDLMDQYVFNRLIRWALGVRELGTLFIEDRTFYGFRESLYDFSVKHPDKVVPIHRELQKAVERAQEIRDLAYRGSTKNSATFVANLLLSGRLSWAYHLLVRATALFALDGLPEALTIVNTPIFARKSLARVRTENMTSRLKELLALMELLVDLVAQTGIGGEKEEIKELMGFLARQEEEKRDGSL